MGKDNKEFEWRMQGMVYATKMAKDKGVDFLEQDIKRRNFLKADIVFKEHQVREFWENISWQIEANIVANVLWTLYDQYGFRKERLVKFRKALDKTMQYTLDLDYMGEHYVRVQDYAVELNKKYNLGLDVDLLAACQDIFDKQDPDYKNTKQLDGIINSLRLGGYYDAANYLISKKGHNEWEVRR